MQEFLSYHTGCQQKKDSSGTEEKDWVWDFWGEDDHGKYEAHRKFIDETVSENKTHIESFSTVESHYCRKDVSRQYLESAAEFQTLFDPGKCSLSATGPVSHTQNMGR